MRTCRVLMATFQWLVTQALLAADGVPLSDQLAGFCSAGAACTTNLHHELGCLEPTDLYAKLSRASSARSQPDWMRLELVRSNRRELHATAR